MTELPARDVRSTISYPELGKTAVDSWMPVVTGHQEAWACPPQSTNPLAGLVVSPTNDPDSQNVVKRPESAHAVVQSACEAQKDECNGSRDAIIAQVDAARTRNHRIPGSSIWVNDTALLNLGNGMHHVRYEIRRTVVATRKKRQHHANGSLSTSHQSARQFQDSRCRGTGIARMDK